MGHVGVFGKWFIFRSPKGRRQGLDKLVLCDLASNRVTMVGLTLPKLSKINRYGSMSYSQYYNRWLLVYLEAQTLLEDIQLMPREIVDFVGQRGGAIVYIILLYTLEYCTNSEFKSNNSPRPSSYVLRRTFIKL